MHILIISVSKLLFAFSTVLPFLPLGNPPLFQSYSPKSASLIQIPALGSFLPGLARPCSRVVFPWAVLLGCCEGGLGAWEVLLQCQSWGLFFSCWLQWDHGGLRNNVLKTVFRGCCGQTLKPLVFHKLHPIQTESRVHPQKQQKPPSQILSTNHTEVRSPQ